jgi:hypothetical protein
MKTYGLIWPNGDKELRSIVLDAEGNPRMDTLEPYHKPDDWQAPQVLPLIKIPKPEVGAWEPSVVWFDDRVERQWVAGTPAPLPTITAEEHLRSVGLGGERQPTLLYLRQTLAAAGKTCAELDAVEAYLQQILALFAADPAPRNDWPNPSVTFEAAVQSAMNALNS